MRAGACLGGLALATVALVLLTGGDALAQQHPQVGGLRLSSEEPGVLTVEWEAAEPEAVDYRVNWARSDHEYPTWTDERGNFFPSTNSLTLSGLDQGAEYKVQVRARYGGSGSGPWSEEARLSVAAAAEPGAASEVPPAPVGLEATVEAGGMRLSWQATASGLVTGYQIERWRPLSLEGAAALVADTGSAATQYLDGEGLQAGVRYHYRVRAWRGTALGPASAVASVYWYPLPALQVERDGAGALRVSWTAAWPPPNDYRVNWAPVDEPYPSWTEEAGNAYPRSTELRLTELSAGVEYKVRVRPRYRWTGNVHSGEWSEARAVLAAAGELAGVRLSGLPPAAFEFEPQRRRYELPRPAAETATVTALPGASGQAVAVAVVRAGGPLALDESDTDPAAPGRQVRLSSRGDTLLLLRTAEDGRRGLYTLRLRPPAEGGSVARSGASDAIVVAAAAGKRPASERRASGGPRQQSTAPRLSALAITPGTLTPAFAAETFAYTAAVGHETSELTLTAAAAGGGSLLVVPTDTDAVQDGYQIALGAGQPGGSAVETLIVVVVQSADGLQLDSYQVTVSRAAPPSEDARLSALSLEGLELSPAFEPDTLAYQTTAGNALTQVTISVTARDAAATAVITPADADASTDVHELALSVGDNVVTVLVTAEDGVSTRSYTVTVRRQPPPSSDARLASLSLDAGQLQPGFAPDVPLYTAALDWAVNRVTLSLTPAEAAAVVQVAPADADPDSDGYQFELPPAEANGAALSTPVAIVVTAPDGAARRTYLLTLERAARPSGDATLASLTVAGLELMPAFASQTLSYEATAGADVSQVTISAVANHAAASPLIDPPDADPTTDEHEIELLARTTSVTITVTAPDGVTTETYALTITSDGVLDTEIMQALPQHCTLRELGPGESTPDVKFDRRCRSLFFSWSSRGTLYFRLLLREEGEVRLGVDAGFSTHLVLRSAAGDVLASALRPSGLSQGALYSPTITRTLAAGAYLVELIASGIPFDRNIRFQARGSNIVRPMAYRLEALSISDVNLNSFDIETFTYSRNVAGDVAFVTVTPTPTLSGALVRITPADADPSTDVHEVSITDQQTSIQIHVSTPEAPQLVQSYEVSLNRLAAATSPLSNDTTLSALTFDSLDIGSFSPDVSRYSYTIGYYGALDGFTTTVLPSPTSPTATWTISHPDVDPDQEDYQLRLDGGTPVVITVHSEDGASRRAYTVAAKSDYHPDPETNFYLGFPVAAPHITWTDGDIILGKSYYGSEFFVFEFSSGRLLERFEAGGPLDQWRFGTVFALWSHGGVVWALDYYRDKLTAFEYESRTLQPQRDISVPEVTRYGAAVWSDGVTAYVIDKGQELVPVLLSYDLRTRRHVRSIVLTQHSGRGVLGMWSDGEVMWINGGYDVRAFELSSGRRIPGLDFTPDNPSRQLWSDGRTFWVLDGARSTMQAYTMPEHAKLKELSFSSGSMGLFNGGIFEYDLKVPAGVTSFTVSAERAFTGGASAVEMSIPDVDGDSTNGYQIALPAGEEKVLTITVTAPNGSDVEVYTVRLRHAD